MTERLTEQPAKNIKFLTISEFAKAIGISQNTIRKWESKGLLKPHHKTPGGRRLYSNEQVNAYLNQE